MPASYKSKERRTAKMMAKSNWFKCREEQGKSVQPTGMRIPPPRRVQDEGFQQDGGLTTEEPGQTVEHSRRTESEQMKKRGPGRPTLSV